MVQAAYYNPITNSYFAYPFGTSTATICAAPSATPNTANCGGAPVVGHVTPVGAYTNSASPYGTFDQGGNVFQWNEQSGEGGLERSIRGGSWVFFANALAASTPDGEDPTEEDFNIGFRVASLVPEPGTGLLVMAGVLGLAIKRHRTAEA